MYLINKPRRRKARKANKRRRRGISMHKNPLLTLAGNRPKRRRRNKRKRSGGGISLAPRRVYIYRNKKRSKRHRRNASLARRIPAPLSLAKSAGAVLGGVIAPGLVESLIPYQPTSQAGMILKKIVSLIVPGLAASMLGFNRKTVNLVWLGVGVNGLISVAKMQGVNVPGFTAGGQASAGDDALTAGLYPQESLSTSDQSLSMPTRLQSNLLQ